MGASIHGKKIECAVQESSGLSIFFEKNCIGSGRNEINISASNAASQASTLVVVELIQPISDLKVLVNPFVTVDYKFVAYANIGEGTNIKVTWSLGDQTGDHVINCRAGETCAHGHTYMKSGSYVITAKAMNDYSNETATAKVEGMYPINGWSLVPGRISQVGTKSYVLLKYNNSLPFPTNATYKLESAAIDSAVPKNLVGGNSVNESMTFHKEGCYKVKVTIVNKVSEVVK